MKKELSKIKNIGFVFLLVVGGCSKDWSCPAEKGFSCKTISEVDGDDAQKQTKKERKKQLEINKKLFEDLVKPLQANDGLAVTRTQEVVGKVLIAPYLDKNERLHTSKYIYTVDTKPEWRIINHK